MRATGARFEVIGDGLLVTFGDSGGSMFFEERGDAEAFGRNLMMAAALGGDSLEEELHQLAVDGDSTNG